MHFRNFLSVPFIWGMVLPILILDISLEIYHHFCFRLYGLPIVPRSKYIKIDRYKLSYLKWYEKINCLYCGYGNGLFAYACKIAADTETHWCGIKHKDLPKDFKEPAHHRDFTKYGDEKCFKKKYKKIL